MIGLPWTQKLRRFAREIQILRYNFEYHVRVKFSRSRELSTCCLQIVSNLCMWRDKLATTYKIQVYSFEFFLLCFHVTLRGSLVLPHLACVPFSHVPSHP